MSDTVYWVWLTTCLNFSSSAVAKILKSFTPYNAYKATLQQLSSINLTDLQKSRLLDKNLSRAQAIVEKCNGQGIEIVTFASSLYPSALARLHDKPFVIYVKGNAELLKSRKTCAFIGTRKMTERGKAFAEKIADGLLDEGYLLISGAAEGIDAVAAKKSLERGLPTVAVLGVDIDKYFPKINTSLIDKISKNGAVISEYPPDTNARFFSARNRIIVGLSDRVNVIEAPFNSGALIGARLALKLNIPLYALGAEGANFAGCRQLIENGATDLNTDACNSYSSQGKADKDRLSSSLTPEGLDGARAYIYSKLLDGEHNENSLVCEKYGVQAILCALTELELDGYIKALPGGKYAIKNI